MLLPIPIITGPPGPETCQALEVMDSCPLMIGTNSQGGAHRPLGVVGIFCVGALVWACGDSTPEIAPLPRPPVLFVEPAAAPLVDAPVYTCESIMSGQVREQDVGYCTAPGARKVACSVALSFCDVPFSQLGCYLICERRSRCCSETCGFCLAIENLPCEDCGRFPEVEHDGGFLESVADGGALAPGLDADAAVEVAPSTPEEAAGSR